MRPISLRIAGFTSFREEQEINFSDLDLFAITGPTGSGKSSILDAMTYALYGKAERVMDRVRQLVSQGQPRASVELTFDVAGRVYRVTRLTRAGGGAATTLLQRRELDGSWVQYGPGADRVREVENAITELIGLDYTGFTRSVVLPQGQFHRFLAGEARERRNILTDLLGLGLYERMAGIAHQQAVAAEGLAATTATLVETEYDGVSAEAVGRAEAEAKEAKRLLGEITAARKKVAATAERVRATEREAAELRGLVEAASELGERAGEIRGHLEDLGSRLAQERKAVTDAEVRLVALTKTLEKAQADEQGLEETGGSLAAIEEGLGRLREAAGHAAAAENGRVEAAKLTAGLGALEHALELSASSAEAASASRSAAVEALEKARGEREAMETAHRVAALVADHTVGDPCPVCGRKLLALPTPPGVQELRATEMAVAAATSALRTADAGVAEADAGVRDAQGRLEATKTKITTLQTQASLAQERAEMLVSEVRANAKLGPKADPEASLLGRRDALRLAQGTTATARDAVASVERGLAQERGRVEVTLTAVSGQRDVLAASGLAGLAARAKAALGSGIERPTIPAEATPEEFATVAGSVGSVADKLAGEARRKLDTQAASLERAAAEARALANPFDLDGDSVAEVQAAIEERFIEERTRVETIGTRITTLKERLVRRGDLEASVATNQKRGRTMRTLAQALHSDRLIAFVQGEALERLAIAASEHLRDLSGGRYRLGCNDDDFEVVDTWNGDERRNVRTLSGGETFLASLSLALALAEQLSALAVGGHARLDSLFLDEGFGSLDPETLEVVTAAVETLREGGRLVGIITHIAELAERMPVRFVIAKSPRGSRVRREGPAGVEVSASAAAS